MNKDIFLADNGLKVLLTSSYTNGHDFFNFPVSNDF